MSHPKLTTLLGDYRSLHALDADLSADEIFIALGTTKKKSPNKKTYYQLDHDYPVLAAQITKARGAKSVFLVTAVGANLNSRLFYIRTKGETERDIIALDFDYTHIFRPSMITGDRQEKRPFEKVMIGVWSVMDLFLLGQADKYRSIAGQDIAKAMRASGKHQSPKIAIYHWKEMKQLIRELE